MVNLLIRWVISAAGLAAAAFISSKLGLHVHADVEHPLTLFLGTAVLGLINATIGTLVKLLTFPLIVITFGLFAIVINAALFLWVGSMQIGFTVGNFWDALVCSLIMGILVQWTWRVIK